MDLGTGLALLGSAKVLEKFLGPTAEYLGNGVKHWTERGVHNVNRILRSAVRQAGDRIEEPGALPPKVVAGLITDGQFVEDPLAAEYFGGVLASSRSGVSRDDRGACFLRLLGGLSTYQIRGHHIIYTAIKECYDGSGLRMGISEDRMQARIFISEEAFMAAMDFTEEENADVIIGHALFGLSKENLIHDAWAWGDPEVVNRMQAENLVQSRGLVVTPSSFGSEFALWAHGYGGAHLADFFTKETLISRVDGVAPVAAERKPSARTGARPPIAPKGG